MTTVICFRHSTYDGSSSPVLSCKVCCGIFIAAIKERNELQSGSVDTRAWLQEKARDARAAPLAKVSFGLDPQTI